MYAAAMKLGMFSEHLIDRIRLILSPAAIALTRVLIRIELAQSARAIAVNKRRISNDLTAHLLYPKHRAILAEQLSLWRAEIDVEHARQAMLKAKLEALQ
jgi:hypothetical protein